MCVLTPEPRGFSGISRSTKDPPGESAQRLQVLCSFQRGIPKSLHGKELKPASLDSGLTGMRVQHPTCTEWDPDRTENLGNVSEVLKYFHPCAEFSVYWNAWRGGLSRRRKLGTIRPKFTSNGAQELSERLRPKPGWHRAYCSTGCGKASVPALTDSGSDLWQF